MQEIWKNRVATRWLGKFRSQSGFGIVEVLIASLMVGLVSFAALNFYQNQHGQFIQQGDVQDMQQNLRIVMDELSRQIRRAGYGDAAVVAVEILSGNDSLLVRYHDGVSMRTHSFYLQDNMTTGRREFMSKLDGQAASVFAEGIDSVSFTAGGVSGTEWVQVDLVAKSRDQGFKASGGGTYLYRRLSSHVKLRNR